MRVAVNTPKGNVGHYLTQMLIRAGVRPMLLMRDPRDLPDGLREFADTVAADSRRQDQVVAATRNVDAIYWVDPTPTSDDPLGDHARATDAIVAAVQENGISRVVFQSSVGAELRHGAGEIDGLAATEMALDQLNIDVTHLRCGYFFTNLMFMIPAIRAGKLDTVVPVDAPISWVSPRDIAEVAATTLLNPAWDGQRVQAVHGPEDLTWEAVANVVGDATGRQVVAERISDDAMYERYIQSKMSAGLAEAVLGMSTGLRDGFVPEQPRSSTSTTPTRLTSYVREELAPIVQAPSAAARQ